MGGGRGYSQAPPQQQRPGTKPQGALPPTSTGQLGYQTRADQPVGAYQAPRNPRAQQMAAFLQALRQHQAQGGGQGQGQGGGYGMGQGQGGGYGMGLGARNPYGQEPHTGQGGPPPGMGSPMLNRWRPGLPGGGGYGAGAQPQPQPQTGGTMTNTAPSGGPEGYVPASGGDEQGAMFMGGRWWKPPAA